MLLLLLQFGLKSLVEALSLSSERVLDEHFGPVHRVKEKEGRQLNKVKYIDIYERDSDYFSLNILNERAKSIVHPDLV